jgi:hypothetical protein
MVKKLVAVERQTHTQLIDANDDYDHLFGTAVWLKFRTQASLLLFWLSELLFWHHGIGWPAASQKSFG